MTRCHRAGAAQTGWPDRGLRDGLGGNDFTTELNAKGVPQLTITYPPIGPSW